MTDRARSRPWNKGEDDLLKQGVERYGAQDNWIAVAELVPNRTNKACRKVCRCGCGPYNFLIISCRDVAVVAFPFSIFKEDCLDCG